LFIYKDNVHEIATLVMNGGTTVSGLITMDDLTNEEILEILEDAERLLPVAKGRSVPAPITRSNSGQLIL